jgi:methylmalonyl-CoA/ethylmalonyl-CoA epimerase
VSNSPDLPVLAGIRVLRIDHVGVAVRRLAERLATWESLGLVSTGREVVAEQKVEVAFLPLGESNVELLEPTSEDSPIARFLASRGEGIHHLCVAVENIDAALETLRSRGVPLINPAPVVGAHGARIAFVHPRGTGGILLELKQPADGH